MFLKIALLFVAFAAVSANNPVAMRPCGNGQPMPSWFESPHCSGSHCNMIRGQTFTGRAGVTLPRAWQTLNIALRARILTVNVPLSIAEGYENACGFLEGGHSCPTPANTPFVWALQFPILPHYPAMSNLIVELEVYDAAGIAACAQIDATMV